MLKNDITRPDVLEGRSGGGLLSLFGLPFLAAGLFVWASGVGLVPQQGRGMPLLVALPFGGIFVAVGVALVFGRGGTIIDRRRGVVTQWWGLLVAFRSHDRRVDELGAVTVTKEVRRSDKSTYIVFPVRLSSDPKPVKLEEHRRYEDARRTAEQVAKHLALPLHDSSNGDTVIREPGILDLSLKEQLLRTGEAVVLPPPPEGMRTVIRRKGTDVRLDIPAAGFAAVSIGIMIASLVFALFVTFTFLVPLLTRGPGMPAGVRFGFGLFIGFFFILLPLATAGSAALRMARETTSIILTQQKLVFETRALWKHTVKEILLKDLEELTLSRSSPVARSGPNSAGNGIILRSDEISLEFGGHLPPAEKEYLAAVIKQVVAADGLSV